VVISGIEKASSRAGAPFNLSIDDFCSFPENKINFNFIFGLVLVLIPAVWQRLENRSVRCIGITTSDNRHTIRICCTDVGTSLDNRNNIRKIGCVPQPR